MILYTRALVEEVGKKLNMPGLSEKYFEGHKPSFDIIDMALKDAEYLNTDTGA